MTENSTRAISGLLYVGLILGSLYSGLLYFTIVISVFSVLVLWEYSKLTRQQPYLPMICFGLIVVGNYFQWLPGWIGELFILTALVAALLLSLGLRSKRPFTKLSLRILSWTYILGGSLAILELYNQSVPPSYFVVLTYGSIWTNNTFAYVFGKTWGKRLLAPNISPKKSWEGFVGGTLAAVVFNLIFGTYFYGMPWIHALVFGGSIGVLATLGDLVQSQMKRQAKVKDSGSLIPGHGGFFDRMDSIIFTAPVITGVHLIIFYVS